MKKIYGFTGYSKDKKIKMVKDYIRSESKNLGGSYGFIFLSSSRPIISSMNGAIYVLVCAGRGADAGRRENI